MNWNQYQRLQTIYDYMFQMEFKHPDIVKVLQAHSLRGYSTILQLIIRDM